jgi:hypothetical protein
VTVWLSQCGAGQVQVRPEPESSQPTAPITGPLDQAVTAYLRMVGLEREAWVMLEDDELGRPPVFDTAEEQQLAQRIAAVDEQRLVFLRSARELGATTVAEMVDETWESCLAQAAAFEPAPAGAESEEDFGCEELEEPEERQQCEADRVEVEAESAQLAAEERLFHARSRAQCLDQVAGASRDGLLEILSRELDGPGERDRAAACARARVQAFADWDRQALEMARGVGWIYDGSASTSSELASVSGNLENAIAVARDLESDLVLRGQAALPRGPSPVDELDLDTDLVPTAGARELELLLDDRRGAFAEAVDDGDMGRAVANLRDLATLATRLRGEIDLVQGTISSAIDALEALAAAIAGGRDGFATSVAEGAGVMPELRTAIARARDLAGSPDLARSGMESLGTDLREVADEWVNLAELEAVTADALHACSSDPPSR